MSNVLKFLLKVPYNGQYLCYDDARGGENMKTIYVTLTGTDFCCGLDFFRRHDALILKKEPKNEWDREAIAVYREGLGKVGYVANSPKTVLGESYSAGRLYDKIGKKATARVEVITDKGVLCKVKGPFKD